MGDYRKVEKGSRMVTFEDILVVTSQTLQEAQLPQRNSASAAHMEGLGPPAHSASTPLATPLRMVESESHNVRRSSVLSTKRTLR